MALEHLTVFLVVSGILDCPSGDGLLHTEMRMLVLRGSRIALLTGEVAGRIEAESNAVAGLSERGMPVSMLRETIGSSGPATICLL